MMVINLCILPPLSYNSHSAEPTPAASSDIEGGTLLWISSTISYFFVTSALKLYMSC